MSSAIRARIQYRKERGLPRSISPFLTICQRKPRQFQPDFHAELVRIADQQMEKVC